MLKAFGRSFQASVPCLPLPLHRPSPFLQPLQKNTYHLPFLPLPLHQPLNPHNLLKSTSILHPAPHSCLLMNVPLVLHPHCPLSPHQPFQNRTIPRLAPHSCHMNALPVSHPSETLGVQLRASMPVPCQRELDCDKAISYYKLQHSAISSTLIFDQPYLSQD